MLLIVLHHLHLFIGVNFKKSALNEQASLECHYSRIAKAKHKQVVAAGKPLKRKSNKERAGVKKFVNIAYFIALKGRPLTNFKGHIKLHEVKFYTNS